MEAEQLAQKTGKQSACPVVVIVIVVSSFCTACSFSAGSVTIYVDGRAPLSQPGYWIDVHGDKFLVPARTSEVLVHLIFNLVLPR
jgi:hypothetical protein